MSAPPRTTASRRLAQLTRGVGALIVLIAIVAGVPVLMAVLHMVPHTIPSLHQVSLDLRQRDNGQLAAVVIAAGVWICWALFALSLIPEIVAAASKRPSRSLPGLTVFQRPAASLIATIAIGFTIAPLLAAATSTRADADPPLSGLPVSGLRPVAVSTLAPGRTATQAPSEESRVSGAATSGVASAKNYLVQRHDTLWKIAADHLGDPLRYTEIVALNPHAVGPDNEITTGTLLKMPINATGLPNPGARPAGSTTGTTDVQVVEGDTLWSIEERVTGAGTNWQAGWEANEGRAEPGGMHFDDPNLIEPGWELTIPILLKPPEISPIPMLSWGVMLKPRSFIQILSD